jgi:hypothetical protein
MSEGRLDRQDGHFLAWKRTTGRGPSLVWLGGLHSDMEGTKALALAEWAEGQGRDFLRFDYFGHGASSGAFVDGTIGRWHADTLAVLDELTSGPLILIGSSMGGWQALLAARARPERVKAMILIAPAPDFTERLMKPGIPPEGLAELEANGVWTRPSAYDDGGYQIARALIEDGARWSVLDAPIPFEGPVRILQGGADDDVPASHAALLIERLTTPDLVFTLIKDGDHRLSRPADLARLIAAVEEVGADR